MNFSFTILRNVNNEKTYLHNGYIDIFNTEILKNGTISGDKIYPYIMNKEDTIDIDSIEDWEKALI